MYSLRPIGILPLYTFRQNGGFSFYYTASWQQCHYGVGHTFGVRVDGASPRRFLRFVSLTAFQAEGCGGGFAFGHACGVRVDGASPRRFLRFLSLTAFQAEGCGIAPWAMSIKSALRDWLSMSYSMISILRIGSLRSPPPIQLRRTSPYSGGRIKHRETLSS